MCLLRGLSSEVKTRDCTDFVVRVETDQWLRSEVKGQRAWLDWEYFFITLKSPLKDNWDLWGSFKEEFLDKRTYFLWGIRKVLRSITGEKKWKDYILEDWFVLKWKTFGFVSRLQTSVKTMPLPFVTVQIVIVVNMRYCPKFSKCILGYRKCSHRNYFVYNTIYREGYNGNDYNFVTICFVICNWVFKILLNN